MSRRDGGCGGLPADLPAHGGPVRLQVHRLRAGRELVPRRGPAVGLDLSTRIRDRVTRDACHGTRVDVGHYVTLQETISSPLHLSNLPKFPFCQNMYPIAYDSFYTHDQLENWL